MRRMLCLFCFLLSAFCLCEGQTTHNLEIIWHCPKPDTFPWEHWGYAVTSGDYNDDGDIEIVSFTTKYNIGSPRSWKKYLFSSNPLDTMSEIVILDSLRSASPPAMCSGDFNGDGITDLAISDPVGWDTLGRVDIYYGRVGFDLTPDTCIRGPASVWGCEFGRALASGDVNGDGISDLIAGAYWGNRVFIYFGDTLGIHTVPDVTLRSQIAENYGLRVASGGDMDGDGYDEVVVGASENSQVFSRGGKIYIYRGGNPMDTIPYAWMFGENSGANLGAFTIAGVPNPNGWFATGFWGTPFSPSYPSPGRAYWLYGGSGFDGTPDLTAFGDFDSSGLGFCSANAGDVDSNRYNDFICGAAYERKRGAAYVWLGSAAMSGTYSAYIRGIEVDSLNGMYMTMGGTVVTVGDIDQDGKDEIAVSNYFGDTLNAIWICKYIGPGAGVVSYNNSEPLSAMLLNNAPNPFSAATIIKYQIKKPGPVNVRVYNIAGQLVRDLVKGFKATGAHTVKWDGRNQQGIKCSPGIYVYKFEAGGSTMIKRMTLVR